MPLPRIVPSLLTAVCVMVAACRPPEPPEIRIGLLATFTGAFADVSGRPSRDGAALAMRDAGDVVLEGRRYRVRLVERDFADRADAAAGAARALINQDSVVAIVGPPFSRHAVPVSVVVEDAHIPMITPMASNPAVTAGKRWAFRLAFLDDVQGEVLARFAAGDLRARRAAVLYDVSNAYSRDLAERFRATLIAGGGRVVAFETYTADRAADVDPALRRIAASRPDVLFLPNNADQVRLQVAGVQRLGLRVPLLGSDSWDPPSLAPLLGQVPAYVTNQWRPDIPLHSARRFVEAYRAAYGADPRATAAMTYDAVTILLDAIRRAGTLDPDSLRVAIEATRDFAGAGGTISFAGGHDPARDVAVSRIQDGALTTVRLVSPGR